MRYPILNRRLTVLRGKIYFDGYLPPSKWDVRTQRLIAQSEKLRSIASRESQGILVPLEDVFAHVSSDISLTKAKGRNQAELLPHPAFLVPAVLEALRSHFYWGDLVQIVTGEADDACVADIKQNGGTVLTGDSDLLIQDLGTNGFVCFFSDIEESHRDVQSSLQTVSFNYRALGKKLDVEEVGGLLRVAYEMSQRKAPLDKAIQFAKRDKSDWNEGPSFVRFEREHTVRTFVSRDHPVLGAISTLDPRICELIIQSQISHAPVSPDAARGHEQLSMFLPVMTEDPYRQSSWTMSTNLRALAYSLVQTVAPHPHSSVIEYRLLSAGRSQAGRQIDVYDLEGTARGCADISSMLEALGKIPELKDDLWLSFTIWKEFQWCLSEGGSSKSPSLVQRAVQAKSSLVRYPWDLVHFTAHVNATLYSLRMLQQVLGVVNHLSLSVQDGRINDLEKRLKGLPRITRWPSIATIQAALVQLGSAGLSSIAGLSGIPLPELQKTSTNNSKKRKKTSSNGGQTGRPPPKSSSTNPFAALSRHDD